MAVYFYQSPSGDGWRNLAVDRYFLEHLGAGDIMLYFYINENAVIIGKNQNAWKECNLEAMDRDGVQLVRRHPGLRLQGLIRLQNSSKMNKQKRDAFGHPNFFICL